MFKFNSIEEAICDIKEGKMVIVVDDEDRENEGDLLMAAEKVTPEDINFMIKYGRGLACMPIIGERLKELNLNQMVDINTDTNGTAFTVSIDSVDTTTGISSLWKSSYHNKVLTANGWGEDFKRPGHVFPIRSKRRWSIKKSRTYRSCCRPIARLAGFYPAGVICEIVGKMEKWQDFLN